MKKIVIATYVSRAALCTNPQEGFSAKGKLSDNNEGKKVISEHPNPSGLKEDLRCSTIVHNDMFTFIGKLVKDMTNHI